MRVAWVVQASRKSDHNEADREERWEAARGVGYRLACDGSDAAYRVYLSLIRKQTWLLLFLVDVIVNTAL
jgi:hypothetical protein